MNGRHDILKSAVRYDPATKRMQEPVWMCKRCGHRTNQDTGMCCGLMVVLDWVGWYPYLALRIWHENRKMGV